jgi:hypothetical protein
VPWPVIDLRMDCSDADPVADLSAIWKRYAPRVDDDARNALHPDQPDGSDAPAS